MSIIYEKAIKLLKIRPHHSSELSRKLLQRGFATDEIEEVIRKLQEENLIDNDQFAQMYLDELLRNKTFGFYGYKSKLMQRGIASNEAEKILKENLSFETELEIARKFLNKSSDLPKQKIVQRLSARGFRSDVIKTIVQDFC
jgi:regulatory protein